MRKSCQILLFSLCLIATFSLAACGFKLASSNSVPAQLHVINYQADNQFESFAIKLKKQLVAYGITINDGAVGNHAITLHLQPTVFSHGDVSTGPSTQARVYNLLYTATFSLVGGSGKTIFGPTTVISSRDITMAPNEVFDVSTQVDMTKQSMEQELLTKMFSVINSRQVREALR